jgi:uncharacterized membrane protein YbhN (UPF0104 family)
MKSLHFKRILPFIGISLFAVSLVFLWFDIRDLKYDQIITEIHQIPAMDIFYSAIASLLSYLILIGYDDLALRIIKIKVSLAKISVASFIGYAINNSMSLATISGASIRLRFYAVWGMGTIDIAKVVTYNTITMFLGVGLLGGLFFVFKPIVLPSTFYVPFQSLRIFGIVLLSAVAGYFFLALRHKKSFRIGRKVIELPTLNQIFLQVILSVLDWIFCGVVLYTLLRFRTQISFLDLMYIFLIGHFAGTISQVPGGLGVFETTVLKLMPADIPGSTTFGALILYRLIYYLVPLAIAVLMLAAYEIRHHLRR